jgi:hypothetical protein
MLVGVEQSQFLVHNMEDLDPIDESDCHIVAALVQCTAAKWFNHFLTLLLFELMYDFATARQIVP